MKIGLRGGHSANCKGAIGLRDEYESMEVLYRYVRDILVSNGHQVVDCNSSAYSESAELSEGVSKANNAGVQLFISLHMNSYNGTAYGTEAWTYSSSSSANQYATRLVNNYARLGFYNRGVKHSTGYYELKNTAAPAIIFETCFCDSQRDINIWSPTPWDTLARAICNAIDTSIRF